MVFGGVDLPLSEAFGATAEARAATAARLRRYFGRGVYYVSMDVEVPGVLAAPMGLDDRHFTRPGVAEAAAVLNRGYRGAHVGRSLAQPRNDPTEERPNRGTTRWSVWMFGRHRRGSRSGGDPTVCGDPTGSADAICVADDGGADSKEIESAVFQVGVDIKGSIIWKSGVWSVRIRLDKIIDG